jgi:hypothetical protein
LNELVEDGVFTSEQQRERFRSLYEREIQPPVWRHPAHRWLALGMACVTFAWIAFLFYQSLSG